MNPDSFFTLHFADNSSVCEKEANWSDCSEQKVCEYFGGTKTVNVCTHAVKEIHVKHGDLEHILEVPDGCEVYQANRSETVFRQNGEKVDRHVGKVVGLVKDGSVIEEYFLNGIENQIFGLKK